MKRVVAVLLFAVLLLAVAVVAWYWFNGGVSHRDICSTVCGESDAIQVRMDGRFGELDRRLGRIEGKLDRLLKIAERPLPDGMQEAK